MFSRRLAILAAIGVCSVAVAAVVLPHASFAQTADDVAAKRAQLQSQLNSLEGQIAQTQSTLDSLHGEHQSIQRDIDILNAGIKKSQLQVQATQVQIQALASNISIHTNTIGDLTGKLQDEKDSLAQIIRNTNYADDNSLIELVLSSDDVSSFFGDLDSYATLNQELDESSDQLAQTRTSTETEKDSLVDQKGQQEKLAAEQKAEEQSIVDQQNQKKALLAQTQGQEATYQSIFDTQQKTAAQIRAELFALAGGSTAISLPDAIVLAKQAGTATGVRPAFILAILKQETNIGQNIGTGTWTVDMHPTRDVPVFKVMMQTLGLDPNSVKVSAAPSYGYGGAMGPSQFIPSTWACYGGYINTTTGACGKGTDGTYAGPWKYDASKDRIAKAAGHPGSPSNPYNNLDAFTATAIYMADLGATAQTPAAERTAALKYFAGGNYTNPAYAFYGDGVMGFVDQFQSDIDTLSSS